MTTEADRRAQIMAAAQRRAEQAAAQPAPQPAPQPNPAPMPQAAPQPNPAPMPQAAPARPAGYVDPAGEIISHNPQTGFTVTRVPNGTKPGATNTRPHMAGAVQIGMGTPQTRPSATVTASAGRPQAPPGVAVIPARSPGMSGATPVTTGRPGMTPPQSVQAQHPQQARALTPTQAAAIAPRNVPVVDCALMLAFHARPDLVDTQLRHLGAASVRAVNTVAWVNPGPVPFPDSTMRLLAEMAIFAPMDMGPWMRWAIASQCVTEFVGILDDDCLPGPQWLQRAIERLQHAGEHDVVVAAGANYGSDDSNALHVLGPESPPSVEESPDIGRGGWIMRTDTARRIAASPRFDEILSTGLHVASVIQELGGTHILLPYSGDRSTWGMLERPRAERSMTSMYSDAAQAGQAEPLAQRRATIYFAYRGNGWMPMVVAAQEPTVRTEPVIEATSPIPEIGP